MLELREFTPLDVAGAIWMINKQLRYQIEANRPPMLSYAFVRVIPEEQDSRFWEVIWDLLGAPFESFQEFLKSHNSRVAAQRLRAALEMFSPSESCRSFRSPDIIVIIGTERFAASLRDTHNPLSRPLAFDCIMKELRLGTPLKPHFHQQMRDLLGATRIILFPDDIANRANIGTKHCDLNEYQNRTLERLSVFRFGFTQHMAVRLLNEFEPLEQRLSGPRVRELLNELVRTDALRQASGKYYLPERIGDGLDSPNDVPWMDSHSDQEEEFKKHYAAGLGMAPYLSSQPDQGVALDRAFQPEYVREAERHLKIALRYAQNIGKVQELTALGQILSPLQLFAAHRSWHTLREIRAGGQWSADNYYLAKELLDQRRESGTRPHPGHVATACDAIQKYFEQLETADHHKTVAKRSELLGELLNLLNEAYRTTCHDSKLLKERKYNTVLILSRKAYLLAKYGKGKPEIAEAEALSRKISDLLDGGVHGRAASPLWFDFFGDRVRSHIDAERFYLPAINGGTGWQQLWVKYIGSLALCPDPEERLKLRFAEITPEQALFILAKARQPYERERLTSPMWVVERWEAGLAQFRYRYAQSPTIQAVASAYSSG